MSLEHFTYTDTVPTYFCLIPRRDRVLLLEEADGWTLPHTEHDDFYDDAHGWFHLHVQREMRRQLGLYVTTLRQLTPTICEMELHEPVQTPVGTIWATRNNLETLTLAVPRQRQGLEAWFARSEDSGHSVGLLSAPWEQPGWFERAAAWLQDEVTRLGCTALGDVEQVKVFVFGAVLRIQTDRGYLYFKALLPTVQNEAALILELAKRWLDHVPQILAHDLERRWLLMRDFGGETFVAFSSPRYETVVRTYARLQLSCADDVERWLQLGLPDQRLEKLPSLLAEVVAAARADDARVAAGLTDAQLERLPRLLPGLLEKYRQLEELALPATLVQQDFQWSNVAVKDDGFVFFDWQATVISHPFFSMTRFLDYMPVPGSVDPFSPTLEHPDDARRRELRDAYLEPWQTVAPPDVLQAAFALARELHLSYLAVRWFQNLALFESEEDETVPWALGQILRD